MIKLLGYHRIKGGSRECYSDEVLQEFMEMDENPLKSGNIEKLLKKNSEK